VLLGAELVEKGTKTVDVMVIYLASMPGPD